MFWRRDNSAQVVLDALDHSLAIIEFTPDGKILRANANFCAALGYSADEIIGQHHRLFVEPVYAQSPEYQAFWEKLRSGAFDARQYLRIGKGGKRVWIQASYNPVRSAEGRVEKVVKIATDITERVNAVTAVGDALADMASGQLDRRITTAFPPDLEKIRNDFNEAGEALLNTIRRVTESGMQVPQAASLR